MCDEELDTSVIPTDGFTGPFTGSFADLTPCKDMESAEEYTAEMKAGRTNKDTLVW